MTGRDDVHRRLKPKPFLADPVAALRVAIILWLVGGALAVLLAIATTSDWVQGIDDWVHSTFVGFDVLVALATALDLIGSLRLMAPFMIVVAIYLAWRRRWTALAFWGTVVVVSQLLVGTMKVAYARPRPPIALVQTTGYSFPSGHALTGAALAFALVIVMVPPGLRRRRLWIVAAIYAVAMAWSRVYVQAHWLSDVTAGVAIGAAVAISAALVIQWIYERRSQRGCRPVDTGPPGH